MKIYDITYTLNEDLPVWPGDWHFRREESSRILDGKSSNSSNIRTALHCGTHLDAPRHTLDDGMTVDQVPPAAVVGPALVVTVRGPEIGPEELAPALRRSVSRVILRGEGQGPLKDFARPFVYPGPAAARRLVEAGVVLVGINSPSVDPSDSDSLEAHRIMHGAGVVILENLLLEGVPDGEYELIALPLKIEGGDGSPVRAVLLQRDDQRPGARG